MKTLGKIVLVAGTMLALSSQANAATQTANLGVSANIAGTCSVGAASIAFGAYTGTALNGGTSVTVNCTTGTGYTLSAGNGNNFATTRRMTSGAANFLGYALYTDAARSNTWDTTVGHTIPGTGSGADQSISVYGQVPASQTANSGNFADTVLMTITY